MKATADWLRRLMREERGNTMILLTMICLMFIGMTMVSLDVFSVLSSRRYAQTDADAAAMAGVQAIQPIVMTSLMKAAQAKIARLVHEAVSEWEADRAEQEENQEGGDSDEHQEPEPVEEIGPLPYISRKLADHIHNSHVVAYILGQVSDPPSPEIFLTTVLTPKERGCALEQVQSEALDAAFRQAEKLIRDPDMTTVTDVDFPFENKPWVVVEIQRTVPSLVFRKVMGKAPTVQVTAGAAVRGMANVTWGRCK